MGLFDPSAVPDDRELTDDEIEVRDNWVRYYTERESEPDDAREFADRVVRFGIKEAMRIGTYFLPPNLGELALVGETVGDETVDDWIVRLHDSIPAKHQDGVMDEDLLGYWAIHPVEREVRKVALGGIREQFIDDVMTKEPRRSQAEARIYAEREAIIWFPKLDYVWADTPLSGPHRALPWEVEERLDSVMSRLGDKSELEPRIKAAGSLNAFFRLVVARGGHRP